MNAYTHKVRSNILPLSVATTLPEAFKEWSFTGKSYDHEEPTESCQLCDHEELRYHFEIQNERTRKTLWVGSQCILKFDVAVFENGRRLSTAEAKRTLSRLTSKMRHESCIKALERLASAEESDILRNALVYYKKNNSLTPKYAFVVLWRLKDNRIDHSPSFFKIMLRKQKHKDDLLSMPQSRIDIIWPALTASQRKIVTGLGITPSPE